MDIKRCLCLDEQVRGLLGVHGQWTCQVLTGLSRILYLYAEIQSDLESLSSKSVGSCISMLQEEYPGPAIFMNFNEIIKPVYE
jgi:hypothetical protein